MNPGWKWAIVILLIWLVAAMIQIERTYHKVATLEGKVNALQELQQERLDAFSKDVYNMTSITELLERQALLLQVIERRTR